MKILHLNHSGSHIGGVEGYIAEVATALQEAGHSSHLVYFAAGDVCKLISHASYAPLPEWPNSPADAIRVLERVILEFRPDLAYIHAVYHPTLVKWVAQHLPTVAYVHGPYLVCPGSAQYLRSRSEVCPYKPGFMCLVNAQLERCCWGRNPLTHKRQLKRVYAFVEAYQHVRAILVGSLFMQQLLSRAGIPSSKISILSPILIRGTPSPLRSTPDSRTILFGGRLVPEKGLLHLIEALARLKSDWSLVVTGDGPERETCQALAAQLGVCEKVSFLGWVSVDEMVANLQMCACVAVPSLWPEPFGRLGPEAFLHGRPVVAFAVGGIPDWLDDRQTGFLVSPGDTVGLSQALQSLLDSPTLRMQMGQRARQRALAAWNANTHVEQLISTFERVRASA